MRFCWHHIFPKTAFRLRFVLLVGAIFSDGIALHVLVEQFIRVQLRAIAGKKEKPNLIGPLFQPLFHFFGPMHRMVVHNEKDLGLALAHQPVEKFQENLGDEPAFEDHEV